MSESQSASATVAVKILSRWDSHVLFEAQVSADLSEPKRLGAAFLAAFAAKANLTRANLTRANLDGAKIAEGVEILPGDAVLSIGPLGSRKSPMLAFRTTKGLSLVRAIGSSRLRSLSPTNSHFAPRPELE